MGRRAITGLVTGVVLAVASFLPGSARAQVDPVRPAVQDSSSKPIGKVVTITGSVRIEHAGAVVVQANVSGQADQAKIGDLVMQMEHLKKLQAWVQRKRSADTSIITAKNLDQFRKPAK